MNFVVLGIVSLLCLCDGVTIQKGDATNSFWMTPLMLDWSPQGYPFVGYPNQTRNPNGTGNTTLAVYSVQHQWEHEVTQGKCGSPPGWQVVYSDGVLLVVFDRVVAINATTGEEMWNSWECYGLWDVFDGLLQVTRDSVAYNSIVDLFTGEELLHTRSVPLVGREHHVVVWTPDHEVEVHKIEKRNKTRVIIRVPAPCATTVAWVDGTQRTDLVLVTNSTYITKFSVLSGKVTKSEVSQLPIYREVGTPCSFTSPALPSGIITVNNTLGLWKPAPIVYKGRTFLHGGSVYYQSAGFRSGQIPGYNKVLAVDVATGKWLPASFLYNQPFYVPTADLWYNYRDMAITNNKTTRRMLQSVFDFAEHKGFPYKLFTMKQQFDLLLKSIVVQPLDAVIMLQFRDDMDFFPFALSVQRLVGTMWEAVLVINSELLKSVPGPHSPCAISLTPGNHQLRVVVSDMFENWYMVPLDPIAIPALRIPLKHWYAHSAFNETVSGYTDWLLGLNDSRIPGPHYNSHTIMGEYVYTSLHDIPRIYLPFVGECSNQVVVPFKWLAHDNITDLGNNDNSQGPTLLTKMLQAEQPGRTVLPQELSHKAQENVVFDDSGVVEIVFTNLWCTCRASDSSTDIKLKLSNMINNSNTALDNLIFWAHSLSLVDYEGDGVVDHAQLGTPRMDVSARYNIQAENMSKGHRKYDVDNLGWHLTIPVDAHFKNGTVKIRLWVSQVECSGQAIPRHLLIAVASMRTCCTAKNFPVQE